MGRKRVIKPKAEDIDYDETPDHLKPSVEETELNHYVEGIKPKRKYVRKKK